MIGWAMAYLAHPAKPALCSDIQPTMLMRKILIHWYQVALITVSQTF